jgi:Flp pilus assembly pilin Flp
MIGRMHARLRADEQGLAFVEFALVAPVLLFLILGGLEVVNYALAQLKVNQIAMTVADNAGRVTTGIDEANVYEVFAGADVIGKSMNFQQNGRIVLSSLQDNEQKGNKHGQMINWQRCWGDRGTAPAYGTEGIGRDDDSLEEGMGAAGNKITSIPGTAVMFVEVSYDYQPLLSSPVMPISGTIRRESAFNVRGRQNNDISNTQGLSKLTC